jgi:hypothetical protein
LLSRLFRSAPRNVESGETPATRGQVAFSHFLAGTLLPQPVRRHAGMISLDERSALYGLTLNYFEGRGIIVDAGCFLGVSTACFGSALRRKGHTNTRIVHSYDLGTIGSANMARLANMSGVRQDVKSGENFAEIITALIAPYADLVDLRIGDIRQTIDEPDPIEILFLDVCKQASINLAVTKAAFPKLIPGHSIVVQQDYFHEYLPWLHMTMGHLSEHFSYLGAAGSSAFFLCERAISHEEAAFDVWSRLAPEEALAAFDRGLPSAMEKDQKYLVDMARAIVLRQFFGESRAVEFMSAIEMPAPAEIMAGWTLPPKDPIMSWITAPNFGY